ncbi:MAG TPA: 16S rRNA (adenine(1518)-N(6)/adenine(1519)-N(6))-dimethyltransferase RsmA [Buchnera sp. (in: enterobacteria)]|nr:16S rRNA (adenine(1518)-N(6)/adenine(1519)-N(6))-dimethyltransferase RsmA [Buchnera sp. (in: enterobacteria)]
MKNEQNYFGHRISKSLGQHFLIDNFFIKNIIRIINPKREEIMFEIGPGMGALTKPILLLTDNLSVIEIDENLVNFLKKNIINKKTKIFLQDILKFNFRNFVSSNKKIRIFGNLPYNISSKIIFYLILFKDIFSDLHFLLQKEVVKRFCATPDTKEYGRLSVLIQYHFNVKSFFDIPPKSFFPIPKVNSSFIRLIPNKLSSIFLKETYYLNIITKLAFSNRRKIIKNSLKILFSENEFFEMNISPFARAENLNLLEYCRLSKYLFKKKIYSYENK